MVEAVAKHSSRADDHPRAQMHPIASLLRGNFTIVWLCSTLYGLAFIGRLGYTRLSTDHPTMRVHIPFATIFFVSCAWNIFHTPGHGPGYRRMHKIVGWTAMLSGLLSVATGYAYMLQGYTDLRLSSQVLMMTVGFMQISLQVLGL